MAIFNPIDVRGPAQHGNQTLQQLAQGAAKNVMRRQRMRALLQQGARGASAGGTQPLRSSVQTRPTGVRGAVLRGVDATAGGATRAAPDFGSTRSDYGTMNGGGGGYDYPSLPDPTDPTQTPSDPNAVGTPGHAGAVGSPVIDPSTGQPLAGGAQWVPATTATTFGPPSTGTALGTSDGTPYHDPGPTSANLPTADTGLIHLGGGLYYNPETDSVHGMPTSARR